MNIGTVLENGNKKLIKHNIKSAMLDSELLLSKVINKSREFIILNFKSPVSYQEYNRFQKLINQRSKGKPIAYLTEKKFFWKNEFFINDKVLIPRPDTEVVVEQILRIYKKI